VLVSALQRLAAGEEISASERFVKQHGKILFANLERQDRNPFAGVAILVLLTWRPDGTPTC
jgi:hypothetical protein